MAWLGLLRDSVLLGTAATALGVLSLAIRLDVPWVPPPPPPEATACGIDEPLTTADPPTLARIDVDELRARLDAAVVVDTRPAAAFAGGHIPGAISLPAEDIDAIIASESLPLPVDRDIVTYCDREGDVDAEYVGHALDTALGCDRVRVLVGGFGAWVAAGAPVEARGALQSG